jgi:hypothetical protein
MVQVRLSLLFACLRTWSMHVYMHARKYTYVHERIRSWKMYTCAAKAAAALKVECSHSSVRLMLACGIGCRIRAGRLESFGSPAQVYMTAWGACVVDPAVYRPDIRWGGLEHRCQVFRHEPTSSWLMPGPP